MPKPLVAIGDYVPGQFPDANGAFNKLGEGVSVSASGRHVAFWGAWGADTRTLENESAPAIAQAMRREEVDLALLAPV